VPINFEKMLRPNVRPEEEVERLRAAFLEGLNNRVNGLNTTNPVIALSGGLDSRATLAGLVYLGIIPKAITYDTDPNNFAEREVARRIADLFGLHLVYLDLPYKNGWEFPIEHYRHFVQLFDGAVSNQTNLMLILEKIAMGGGHGVTYFTGLYGGEMFRYLNITSGLKTNKDLVRYLMTTPDGFRYSLEKVCRIMDMQQNDFEEHLMEHVMEYPEKRATMKYLHFQFEKNFKWAGMGEDRNRYYFWTTTPFFSIPFFEYAYSIHENY
jgi:asparagine synthase (glutamine-hydrolysing)